MRKVKFVSMFVLLALLLSTVASTVLAQEESPDISCLLISPQDRGVDNTYVYPVVPGTDAWAQLKTHDEMIKVTQIPIDVLRDLSTQSLVETVLNYPLYGDILAYDNMQYGFNSMVSAFNGLQELLQRKDAAYELVTLYAAMDPLKIDSEWTSKQKGNYHRQFIYVEALLAQDELLSGLLPEQQLELLGLSWKKLKAKQDLAEIYGIEGLKTSLLLSGRILKFHQPQIFDSASEDLRAFLRDSSTNSLTCLNTILVETASALAEEPILIDLDTAHAKDYYTYVYTPRGSSVPVIRRTYELTQAQIDANDAWVESNYPNAILIRSSSRKYNCHSYAWYSQSSSNNYWMNNPGDDTYWNDGSYYRIYYCPAYNAKASYASDDHSANIDGMGNFTSKWGQLGVVKHATSYCPYNSSTINYYKRN